MICAVELGCSAKDEQITLGPNPDGAASNDSAQTSGTENPPSTDKAQPLSNTPATPDAGTDQQPITAGDGDHTGNTSDAGSGGSTGTVDTWTSAPSLHGTVTVADADLPSQALNLLQGTCGGCHTMDRATLTTFSQYTQAFSSACLSNTDLPDVAAVDA
ncbi:MAG TPA: hypothetical protein VG963_11450, partial [Polyangiaceae bacterium]|nr:hypothetical protein [Polyangiaceae bacterium]